MTRESAFNSAEDTVGRGERRRRLVHREIPLTIIVLVAAFGAGWYGLWLMRMEYNLEAVAGFDTVPPNDDALLAWTQSQPSVKAVRVQRHQVDGKWLIQMSLVIEGNGLHANAPPDIDGKAVELGYRGQCEYFRNMKTTGVYPPSPQ